MTQTPRDGHNMRLDNPDNNTKVGASPSSPPLHAEVRAVIIELIKARQMKVNVEPTADAILQAVADALLSELPKAIESVEVDVEATRRHMESKGATENDIMNMEIEADDRHDVLQDALDAVTRVIGELGGRRNPTTEEAS